MSLPSGYKKLEYIQSSGTQYIDTGFKPKQSTRVVMDLQLLSTSGVPYVFGTWAGGMNNCFSVYWWTDVHNSWGVDYGTQRSAIPQTNWNKRLTVDLNQNVVTVDGISYTLTATTFTATNNLFLLALNNGNNALDYTVAKVYGCKIYDNGMLVRDFIPCKNASGAVGMWDDVNNTFYSNAGSGTFTAGPEAIGSNRVLVNAKGYDANSGTVLVNGMVYHLKKGRGLLNGMGYDIPFNSGTPISDLAVGSTVKIVVNGTLRDFLIVHQGLPSSMYDYSCNGAWLLMKDAYEIRQWNSTGINNYKISTIHNYLNGSFLNLFDSNIKDTITQVKIPYVNGTGGSAVASGVNGLSTKIFLLSVYEVGLTISTHPYFSVDGSVLDYFKGTGLTDPKRIAYLNGSATFWWLRSPMNDDTSNVGYIRSNGGCYANYASGEEAIRPAFILPSDTPVSDDGTITT